MSSSARIEELQKKYDENPRRYFAPLANEFRKAGDAEQAIAICREHLPQQPGHMSGHIVFGQALFEAGQLEESRAVFETALTLDPENLIALRHLGDIASRQGGTEEARSWYTRVLEADPRNVEIASLLANLGPAPVEEGVVEEAPWDVPSTEPAAEPPPEEALLDWETEIDAEPAAEPAPTSSAEFPVQGFDEFEAIGEDEGVGAMDPSSDELFMPTSLTADAANDQYDPGTEPPAGFEPTHSERVPFPEDNSDVWVTGSVDVVHDEAVADGTPDESMRESEELPPVSEPVAEETAWTQPTPSAGVPTGLSASGEPGPPPEVPADDWSRGEPTPSAGVPTGGWHGDMPTPVAGTPIADGEPPAASFDGTEDGADSWEPLPDDAATVRIPAHSVEPAASSSAVPLERPASAEEEDESADRREDAGWRVPGEAPIVTETMAELYLQQGHLDDALSIYQRLVEARPDDSALRGRMEELQRTRLERTGRTMRSFLSALATRRPAALDADQLTPIDELYDDAGAAGEYELEPPVRSSGEVASGAGGLSPEGVTDVVEEHRLPEPSRSIDQLFEGADVSPEDESAAAALADVFTTAEMKASPAAGEFTPVAGRPARPAETELSLDQVFRPAGAGEQRRSGNFSFDQFFAGDADAPARARASESMAQPGAASEDDVEQFNAWLKDLKQR